jgi:hypothetical protein
VNQPEIITVTSHDVEPALRSLLAPSPTEPCRCGKPAGQCARAKPPCPCRPCRAFRRRAEKRRIRRQHYARGGVARERHRAGQIITWRVGYCPDCQIVYMWWEKLHANNLNCPRCLSCRDPLGPHLNADGLRALFLYSSGPEGGKVLLGRKDNPLPLIVPAGKRYLNGARTFNSARTRKLAPVIYPIEPGLVLTDRVIEGARSYTYHNFNGQLIGIFEETP